MSNSQSENIDLNKKKRGRPKTDVWEYFKEGPRNRGHCSAECNFCGWKQQIGVDGWTNACGQSLYAFILITKERKEYVHSVQNLLNYSHTGRFLADKMIEIIENVSSTKFGGIVSDNASAIVFAKN
ncbi:hypothetical protein RhiirA5_382853 [Rhizophagus irregularis]|uniref:Uncharacterized protein n=1 Tax=Rhizophagus irregularis TaxID=588596 RepID=A0A2N0NZB2_9GLOM|nr:hypothetical protein RhiirA5_382853 [Rhizophagus irregularis]